MSPSSSTGNSSEDRFFVRDELTVTKNAVSDFLEPGSDAEDQTAAAGLCWLLEHQTSIPTTDVTIRNVDEDELLLSLPDRAFRVVVHRSSNAAGEQLGPLMADGHFPRDYLNPADLKRLSRRSGEEEELLVVTTVRLTDEVRDVVNTMPRVHYLQVDTSVKFGVESAD